MKKKKIYEQHLKKKKKKNQIMNINMCTTQLSRNSTKILILKNTLS